MILDTTRSWERILSSLDGLGLVDDLDVPSGQQDDEVPLSGQQDDRNEGGVHWTIIDTGTTISGSATVVWRTTARRGALPGALP